MYFDYEVSGRRFTGMGLRLGSEKSVRAAIESYEPGTIQTISYNPKDPSEIETILNYNWELFESPIASWIFGMLLIFGGVGVYRWSYGVPANGNAFSKSGSDQF